MTGSAVDDENAVSVVRVAVIGCGWWAQGWHLPHLAAHSPRIKIAAVVNQTQNPSSTLASSPLLSLSELSTKYNCPCFHSVSEMLADEIVGPTLDGAIIATSHASHYQVGMSLLQEGISRRKQNFRSSNHAGGEAFPAHRVMNILMEKPMTTDVNEARSMWELSTENYPEGSFIINHTASYRPQTRIARHIIASNQIGRLRHISASMNGPLMWLFNDPSNHAWVSKTPWKSASTPDEVEDATMHVQRPMIGNGYAYGQIAHVLAWIYTVLGIGETKKDVAAMDETDIATPTKVYCNMSHAANTGADVSFAAVITCYDGVTFALTGTALLPGSQYSDPPVGKHIKIELFGEEGCLMYGGDDQIPESGRLELRKTTAGESGDGQSIFPCIDQDLSDLLDDDLASELKDGFYFEDGEQEGCGPGSMKLFLNACCASSMNYARGKCVKNSMVNDSLIGLRTVQVIDAMYRSSISGNVVDVR